MPVDCPACKAEAKRLPRKTLVDFLLSIAYIYPFRCKSCGHRFRQMQWGVRYVRQ